MNHQVDNAIEPKEATGSTAEGSKSRALKITEACEKKIREQFYNNYVRDMNTPFFNDEQRETMNVLAKYLGFTKEKHK